jgi:octaprenyl-diphosphate synthase
VTERTYRGATLIEILHTATLVHDDVVDDADTRRGFASINSIWRNKVGVLLGDFLLARGLLLSLEHGDHDFLDRTSTAVKRMSEGELLQIQKSRQLNIDEQTYLRIISDKTASLFATCTEIGALSATDDTDVTGRFRTFGEQVGLAFQIRDDLLDYRGQSSVIGKPTGIDIKEKKLTLPLIHALRQAGSKDRTRVLKMVRKGASNSDVGWILRVVEANGGLEYALNVARTFGQNALDALSPLPPSEAKDALIGFVDFVLERDK